MYVLSPPLRGIVQLANSERFAIAIGVSQMKRKAAEVFEPLWRRVFGYREISHRATVAGDSARMNALSTATRLLIPIRFLWLTLLASSSASSTY
jgi:hypothetical protein